MLEKINCEDKIEEVNVGMSTFKKKKDKKKNRSTLSNISGYVGQDNYQLDQSGIAPLPNLENMKSKIFKRSKEKKGSRNHASLGSKSRRTSKETAV